MVGIICACILCVREVDAGPVVQAAHFTVVIHCPFTSYYIILESHLVVGIRFLPFRFGKS